MAWLEYAAWGLFGAAAVDGLDLTRAIRRTGGFPWQQPNEAGPAAFAVTVVIRLALGAGVAAAAGAAGQITGAFAAMAIGVAAPQVIDKLLGQIPLSSATAQQETPPTTEDLGIAAKLRTDIPTGGEDAR
jgi:hypothetical protein